MGSYPSCWATSQCPKYIITAYTVGFILGKYPRSMHGTSQSDAIVAGIGGITHDFRLFGMPRKARALRVHLARVRDERAHRTCTSRVRIARAYGACVWRCIFPLKNYVLGWI